MELQPLAIVFGGEHIRCYPLYGAAQISLPASPLGGYSKHTCYCRMLAREKLKSSYQQRSCHLSAEVVAAVEAVTGVEPTR